MNKTKALVYVLLITLIAAPCFATPRWYPASALTGGSASSLDSVPGQNLNDGDNATVITGTDRYFYTLDADLSGTESSPGIINPDTNPGTKSWKLVFGPLEVDNSDNATVTTGEDDLASTTIPASLLGTTKGLKIKAAGTISGTNDAKVVKLHFGASSWTVVSAAAGDATDWQIEATIYNTSATAQRLVWRGLESDGTETFGYETAAINTAAAVTLKLTGECTNGSDTITQTMWDVRLY